MLKTIIAHEIRLIFRSPAALFMLALFVAAMIFGAWNGYLTVDRKNYSAAVATQVEADIKQRVLDELIAYEHYTAERGLPTVFAPVSHTKPRPGQSPQGTNAGAVGGELLKEVAIQPPTGLSAFAVGQSDLQRTYTYVDMKNKFNMSDNHEIENPLNLTAGSFDIAFVILFILPIFIIALTYDMLSGEKESGTLALAMTQPVSLRTFMAAKLLSRLGILMSAIVLTGAIALLFSAGKLNLLAEAGTWMRFGLWLALVLLYSFFWFALGVLVNAFNKSSETNATILAGCWLAVVVILPALINLAATTFYPAPSRMDLRVAMRDATIEAEKAEDETTKSYFTEHVEMLPDEDSITYLEVFLARQIAIERAVEPVFDHFRHQQERQEAFVSWLQFLTPAVILQLSLNEISGVSSKRYNDYMDTVYEFQQVWRDYFTPRYLRQEVLHSSTYGDFPTYSYPREALGTVIDRVMPSIIGLLLIVLGFTAYAFRHLRRFSVRGGA